MLLELRQVCLKVAAINLSRLTARGEAGLQPKERLRTSGKYRAYNSGVLW